VKRLYFLLPFLAGVAPVIALYANNSGQARFRETCLPMTAVVVATAALLALCRLFMRSWLRAAVLVSIFWLLVFSYGHVARLIGRYPIAGHNPANYKFLLPCVAILGLACLVALRRGRSEPTRIAGIVMVMVAALLLTSGVTIARFQSSAHAPSKAIALPAEALVAHHTLRRPDIYYFILDRYAAARTLQSNYQVDNTPFIAFLRAHGFYVADESRANYLVTAQSLASSLNMAHILSLEQAVGPVSTDWQPVFDLIASNRLAHFLKEQGYRYVHLGPDWRPTRCLPQADVCYSYGGLPDFTNLLLSTTAFAPVLYRMGVSNEDRMKFDGVRRQLKLLPTLPKAEKSPKFVFAHILVPHGPFVFNHDGTFRDPKVAGAHSEHENYVEQLEFITTSVRKLVAEIEAAYPADQQPVIVVQGDEGPYPARTQPHAFDWSTVTDDEINEKMRILNAIYAPGCEAQMYAAMTPVNTFRIVLNHYFGTELPLLADKSYTYRDLHHLYDFIEVTQRIDGFKNPK